MSTKSSKAWFAAKRYGYGAGLPIAWQGWLFFGAFFAVTIAPWITIFAITKNNKMMPVLVASCTAVDFVALVCFAIVCYKKTEGGWRWRWGNVDKH